MLFKSFNNQDSNDYVFEEFKAQIQKKGFEIDTIEEDGVIHLIKGEFKLEISLENIIRNYQRDKDATIIEDFVETIVNYSIEISDNWNDVKNQIFVSFLPNNQDFKNIIHKKITEDFSKIFIYYNNESITWLSDENLKNWNITQSELNEQANKNADLILAKAQIKYTLIENRKLGLIETEDEFLKGTLLFAPSMKDKIKNEIGFPFYAVLPVRDFCYIFSENDFEYFTQRLGNTVIEEYTNSGYPITTEIIKFTDNEIEAVGKYVVE